MSIPFIDLAAQQARLKTDIDAGIAHVLASGQYILGPQVGEFESQLAEFGQARHALGCANGTDALILPMIAWDIPRGSAVFCPSFTYCATAEAIAIKGAVPVFVDIDRDTYNMDPASLRAAVEGARADGMELFGVITVDLFGQCANYEELAPIAREFGLKIIADGAQGFGSTLNGHHPLHWSDVTTTSFYPAKPLGCYGDGGAVLTNDDDLAAAMDSVRIHGKGTDKYDNVRVGLNSRLDTIQAAVLLAKLSVFEDEIAARNRIADRYIEALSGVVSRVPTVLDGVRSTWAQFTVEVPDPAGFAAAMREHDVPTARFYPKPVHRQTAYADFPVGAGGLANTEDCMAHTISLPMHPYLDENTQDRIVEAVKASLA